MAFIVNKNYDYLYLEAQRNLVVTDPYGEIFNIWQGMQFRWIGVEENKTTCGSCGGKTTIERIYTINAWAICKEGEYIWPAGSSYKTVNVEGKYFIETDTLKYPPIINDFARESSGTDTDLFTHPKNRSVPREGGLWYDDPWHTKRTQ
jgi:hypothetical protein